jgi:hypothetical protein
MHASDRNRTDGAAIARAAVDGLLESGDLDDAAYDAAMVFIETGVAAVAAAAAARTADVVSAARADGRVFRGDSAFATDAVLDEYFDLVVRGLVVVADPNDNSRLVVVGNADDVAALHRDLAARYTDVSYLGDVWRLRRRAARRGWWQS